ncbi:hypothetical protein TNCV_4818451 [Trichonephila clavipes]|nr:hypothetical protein TNCV_4818451 [Trichonephila clavipes]
MCAVLDAHPSTSPFGVVPSKRRNMTAAEWNQVIFSDESRFNLSSDHHRVRVCRPRGECLNPAFALQRDPAPTAGVMVRDFKRLLANRDMQSAGLHDLQRIEHCQGTFRVPDMFRRNFQRSLCSFILPENTSLKVEGISGQGISKEAAFACESAKN